MSSSEILTSIKLANQTLYLFQNVIFNLFFQKILLYLQKSDTKANRVENIFSISENTILPYFYRGYDM